MKLMNGLLKKKGEKMMRKLAVCLALVIAVLMVSSAAMAFNFADHVKAAKNAKGDTLIFPIYAAINGGWETKLWVVNTAQDRSVVAKVVVRSALYSQELLDFLIYLTPTDVWTGTLRYNNGRVEYFSDDDSAVSSAGGGTVVWANTTAVTQALSTPRCNDTNNFGYVEVFETSHSYNASTFAPAAGSAAVTLNIPPVNKNALYRAHADLVANNSSINQGLVLDGINVLTGVMEFRNNSLNQKASMQATALRDYGASLGNGDGVGARALNVINVTSFAETSNAFNLIGEVEAALAKNDLGMYYSDRNLSLHVLTFPTKLTTLPTATCTPLNASPSPYFTQHFVDTSGCINYTATHYDVSEQAASSSAIFSPAQQGTLCYEVNILPNPSFSFAQGWARYTFPTPTAFVVKDTTVIGTVANGAAIGDGIYTGAPVMGTILHLASSADGYTAVPAAYTDGLVTNFTTPAGAATAVGTPYYYFQSQDERNTGTASANNNVIGGVAHDGYDTNRPALVDAPIPNENQTRGATQSNHAGQPPVAADAFHPVQTAAPNVQ